MVNVKERFTDHWTTKKRGLGVLASEACRKELATDSQETASYVFIWEYNSHQVLFAPFPINRKIGFLISLISWARASVCPPSEGARCVGCNLLKDSLLRKCAD